MSPYPHQLPPVIGLLDVGTSKIACLMLARQCDGAWAPVGFGHQSSRGLKASVVVDANAAEDAVRATISQAEHMAGTALDAVVLSAACGRIASTHAAVGCELDAAGPRGRPVTTADVGRLLVAGRDYAERDDRAALHVDWIAARCDGAPLDPADIGSNTGRACRRLSLDVHAVTADRSPLRHLVHVAERCNQHVVAICPVPLTSGLAVTTDAERALGAAVVDMGAGSTSLALFVCGRLVAVHVIPIGANHITYDLTRALGVSITEAERIKKICAMVDLAHPSAADAISYHAQGNDHAHTKQATRAEITTIITSRLDALLRQVGARIEQAAIPQHLTGDVVLTGGGSMLAGIAVRASAILGRPARCTPPARRIGVPDVLLQPAFATIIGMQSLVSDIRFAAGGIWLGDGHAQPLPAAANGGSWLRRRF